jgi:maleate cis-trans isomerase
MQAIVFAFTTTSYIQGPDGEQALKVRLEKRANGIPVLLTCLAVAHRPRTTVDDVKDRSVSRRRNP